MATYTITITNNSSGWQTYKLFMEVPVVQNNSNEVFPNVFAVGRPRLNNGSTQTFVVNTEAFAICGYEQLSDHIVARGDDNVSATLTGTGDNNSVIDVRDGGPSFVSNGTGAPAGSFEIYVNGYNAVRYPDVFCGYGKRSPSVDYVRGGGRIERNVNIAACWQAMPNTRYTITPTVKFYVSTGDFTAGEIVRVTEVGLTQLIDFTPNGANAPTYASFEQKVDGSYGPVTYSQSPTSILFTAKE
ncbi:hypothetical protein BDZ85DRAFT_251543 [Elsinoe ampelina]|uniref:Uncharacterized protein n=1 Tax=Elsinoe ampelina TaxID=302913 RepID=A0A6A6G5G0_9PEZI|nr:hypothetical protein BDZ85DRAFT_251543 [Elsinoe ampelina]